MGAPIRKGRSQRSSRLAASIGATLTPTLKQIYAAVDAGHITEEEAVELNPKYNPNKVYGRPKFDRRDKNPRPQILTQGKAYRAFEHSALPLKPSMWDVHEAVKGGHITAEEGVELNAQYDPSDKIQQKHLTKYVKLRAEREAGLGRIPSMVNVYRAHINGKITLQEAQELNPKYDPTDLYQVTQLRNNLKKQDSGYYHRKGTAT